jgi:hypothetical protein
MDLPGYDDWKLATPPEYEFCEFCGADPRVRRDGWQPDECTGECGRRFRDPDAEYDAMRDRERDPEPPGGWDD